MNLLPSDFRAQAALGLAESLLAAHGVPDTADARDLIAAAAVELADALIARLETRPDCDVTAHERPF